jgi:hypothetical protein
LRALHKIAKELGEDGYLRAAEFVRKNAGFMGAFTEFALEDIKIPYATSRIERLMGEASKRCRRRRMHWSTQGLKGILTIAFTRYADKSLCEDFKKAYIHNEIIQWKGYSTTLTGK